MGRLSLVERNRLINLWFRLSTMGHGNKVKIVQCIAREIYSIDISLTCLRDIIKKWCLFGNVADMPKLNKHKCLTSDAGMLAINKLLLKNPFYTCLQIKHKLSLVASLRTIREYINKLVRKKVNTKYFQIVSPINQIKRFSYACCF